MGHKQFVFTVGTLIASFGIMVFYQSCGIGDAVNDIDHTTSSTSEPPDDTPSDPEPPNSEPPASDPPISNPPIGNYKFYDSFESGTMAATNSDGFRWSANNKTSVVSSEKIVWSNGSVNTPIPSGRNWQPYSGKYSLRFLYPAGAAMSEQRFDMGRAYRELWVRYWIRVPTNFYHPNTSPNNQKFLAIWMDGYSSAGAGPTVWLGFWGDGNGGSSLAYTYSVGNNTVGLSYRGYKPFIKVPEDRGRWMQIVFHIKASSSRSANDGVIETWRRWESESQFTKFHEATNANMSIPSSGPSGWKAGYLMGWANAAYSTDTEWLIDDFILSTESLLAP